METITVSKCCKAGVDDLENGKFECWDCGKECEVEEVCEECGGTGMVDIGEFDDIRTLPCPVCNAKEPEENDQDR